MFGYYKAALSIDGKEVDAWQKVTLDDNGSPVEQAGIVDKDGKDIKLPPVYELRIVSPEVLPAIE